MSVGLQRLRDDADTIRHGALVKGEDPSLVDRALELDAERRRLLAEVEALKATATARAPRSGSSSRPGPTQGRRQRPAAAWAVDGHRCPGSTRSNQRRPASRRCSTISFCESRTRRIRTSRSAARRPTSRFGPGASACRSRATAGRASPTGSSVRRSTSSTTPVARRSPAPASRSTRAPGPPSSAA